MDDEILICATCGMPLTGDPGEDPVGGDAGMPICGNCARERDFFDIEILDGALGGGMDLDP